MGQITIEISGSFPHMLIGHRTFSAMNGGHAQAVAEAITFLSSGVLERAIEKDHSLQEQGHYPEVGFGVNLKKEEA